MNGEDVLKKRIIQVNDRLDIFKEYFAQSRALVQEIKIFFWGCPDEGLQLRTNFSEITRIWNNAMKQFQTISEEDLNKEHRKVERHREKINSLLFAIFKDFK